MTLELPSLDTVGLGTCFIVGAMGGSAIAVTALHCLEEAETRDVPNRVSSAPSSLFAIERPEKSWNRIRLGTVLPNRDLPPFMSLPIEVEAAYSNGQTDIAFLLLMPNEDYREVASLRDQVDLCSKGPELGEKVIVAGFFKTEVASSHHRESDGRAAFQAVSAKFQCVEATVTEVLPDGIRDIRWPCFKLDCPLYSGMSGGCVLVRRGDSLLAAGVISRDLSEAATASGAEAFAALLAPALTTAFPEMSYQRSGETEVVQVRSVVDLIKLGVIRDASGR